MLKLCNLLMLFMWSLTAFVFGGGAYAEDDVIIGARLSAGANAAYGDLVVIGEVVLKNPTLNWSPLVGYEITAGGGLVRSQNGEFNGVFAATAGAYVYFYRTILMLGEKEMFEANSAGVILGASPLFGLSFALPYGARNTTLVAVSPKVNWIHKFNQEGGGGENGVGLGGKIFLVARLGDVSQLEASLEAGGVLQNTRSDDVGAYYRFKISLTFLDFGNRCWSGQSITYYCNETQYEVFLKSFGIGMSKDDLLPTVVGGFGILF